MPAKKTAPNKTANGDSKFFVVNTIRKTSGDLKTKVSSYNEKYIEKKIENGKEFLTELKADPIKKFDDLIDDSKDAITEAKAVRVKALRKKVDTTRKTIRSRFNKVNQETRRFYKGIGNDAKLVMDDILELGKKNMNKIPVKKTIEKKISSAIDAIPATFNLPSKSEIDNLVTGIDGVNKKVDELNKQFVSA